MQVKHLGMWEYCLQMQIRAGWKNNLNSACSTKDKKEMDNGYINRKDKAVHTPKSTGIFSHLFQSYLSTHVRVGVTPCGQEKSRGFGCVAFYLFLYKHSLELTEMLFTDFTSMSASLLIWQWKWLCCINISFTLERCATCAALNKRWHLIWVRVGLPNVTSLQIRLQRDILALSLVTGGALWSCNQEPSSWMCSPTMWPYKLR